MKFLSTVHLSFIASNGFAAEPWAEPFKDQKLGIWKDASGHGRHLVQSNADARPTRLPVGTRFPVGMRFNRFGDLTCSDQVGATGLPNGNPLDELLHISKGRHYVFPPRQPKHLPNVNDEPSTFDYGPQHQSTYGICFHAPVEKDGPELGPEIAGGRCLPTTSPGARRSRSTASTNWLGPARAWHGSGHCRGGSVAAFSNGGAVIHAGPPMPWQ